MKILIVGAAYQGKSQYAASQYQLAKEQLLDWETAQEDAPWRDCVAVCRLHLLVKQLLEQGIEPQTYIADRIGGLQSWTIVCDEIGCGIVPMQQEERRWREATGRLCCLLAEQADIVERITCGIPTRLKGEQSS